MASMNHSFSSSGGATGSLFPPLKRRRGTDYHHRPGLSTDKDAVSDDHLTDEDKAVLCALSEKSFAQAQKSQEEYVTLKAETARLIAEGKTAGAARVEAIKVVEDKKRTTSDKEKELEDLKEKLDTVERLGQDLSLFGSINGAVDDSAATSGGQEERAARGNENTIPRTNRTIQASVDLMDQGCAEYRDAIDQLQRELIQARGSVLELQKQHDDLATKEQKLAADLETANRKLDRAGKRRGAWRLYASAIAIGPPRLAAVVDGCGSCQYRIDEELQQLDEEAS